MTYPSFTNFVKENWSFDGNNFTTALKNLVEALNKWRHDTFGDIYKWKRITFARLKNDTKATRQGIK